MILFLIITCLEEINVQSNALNLKGLLVKIISINDVEPIRKQRMLGFKQENFSPPALHKIKRTERLIKSTIIFEILPTAQTSFHGVKGNLVI